MVAVGCRKSLLKKEAPELLPLLTDFQGKLEALKPLLPLLEAESLALLPASGASYLDARSGFVFFPFVWTFLNTDSPTWRFICFKTTCVNVPPSCSLRKTNNLAL